MARSVPRTALNSNPAIQKVNVEPVMKKKKKKATPRRSRTVRAGLVFPVGRINTKFHKLFRNQRISMGASVFIAGALEFLSAELLDIAGDVSNAHKKRRITARHVMLAARGDQEFAKVFSGVVIPEGGVFPKPIPK